MTISPPSNVSYGTVIWRSASVEIDSNDASDLPDFNAITGTITFTPTVNQVIDATAVPNPITLFGLPVVANIGPNGYLGVQIDSSTFVPSVKLLATDDHDLNPYNWAYTVTYSLRAANGRPLTLKSHLIYVPTNGTVDLSTVIPPASATPLGTSQATAAANAAAASAAAAAASAASAGKPVSTDGSFGLPVPTGVGFEFVIIANALDDIRMNGVSL